MFLQSRKSDLGFRRKISTSLRLNEASCPCRATQNSRPMQTHPSFHGRKPRSRTSACSVSNARVSIRPIRLPGTSGALSQGRVDRWMLCKKADEEGYGFAVELLGGCVGRRCDCRVERVQTHFSHNFSLGGGGTRIIPHVVPFYRVSVYMLPDVLEQTRRTLQRRENEGVSDRLKWG